LEPDKRNTDPIHGDICFNHLERLIIDAPAFQRLRRVRQLGTTHLVYPGATHTRFQHSTGALKVVQDLLDHLVDNPISFRGSNDDLLTEWRNEGRYDENFAEAVVLARLGALLHDFCHVPYGHTIEDDFGLLTPHDKNLERFEAFWATIPKAVRDALGGDLTDELRALILSKRDDAPEPRYPFVHDLVGNTICADLIDYLWRDHYYTGLPASLGTRFLSSFYVTARSNPDFPEKMALRITKNGRVREDVVTEVFKYLRYRYELGERALQHHAKVAADAMIAKAFSIWADVTAPEVLEAALRVRGDDGILEYLADASIPGASQLAAAVRDRALFKEVARAKGPGVFLRREKLYEQYGNLTTVKAVEAEIAKKCGLPDATSIALHVPSPHMRLKAADVLITVRDVTTPLRAWDAEHGHRAQEIHMSHERLWGVHLFVRPDISARDRARIAACFAEELRVEWDSPKEPEQLSPVREQVIRELAHERRLSPQTIGELRAAVHRTTGRELTVEEEKQKLAALLDETVATSAKPRQTTPTTPIPAPSKAPPATGSAENVAPGESGKRTKDQGKLL